MIGKIHSFESMATMDGDGIRFAVFMSMCPLRCCFCHNPDTWFCNNSIEMDEETLAKKIKRYKPYFQNDGGVTFTGGEPLFQAEFINKVSSLLKNDDISYILDTSGHVNLTQDVKTAINNSQYVILDLKFWSEETYEKYVKGDFEKVLNFARYLRDTKKKMWIRTVIIPNINDSEQILDKYLDIIKSFDNVEKYELLAFHTMGFFKYENLKIPNQLKDVPPLSQESLSRLQKYVDEKMR